jgi:hypothetical protein
MAKKNYIEFANDGDELEWDDNVEFVQELMDRATHYSGKWHAEVEGFGWRNLDGHKDFCTKDARTLLSELLPNTAWTIRLYQRGARSFKINCTHHDSPMWGKEWYTIKAVK